MQASRLDPPYQFQWTVFISWIIVATAIAELETGRSASPVSRNQHAFRRFSHLQPLFFGVPPELPYLSSEGLWLLKDQFRRSHIVFGTDFSASDIPLVRSHGILPKQVSASDLRPPKADALACAKQAHTAKSQGKRRHERNVPRCPLHGQRGCPGRGARYSRRRSAGRVEGGRWATTRRNERCRPRWPARKALVAASCTRSSSPGAARQPPVASSVRRCWRPWAGDGGTARCVVGR